MAVRVYNVNRSVTKRPDGTPVMIRWGRISFPLPEIGQYVTLQDDRIAKIIVTNFEGLDMVAPTPALPPMEKPSRDMLMAMGGKLPERKPVPTKTVETSKEEIVVVVEEVETEAATEALEKATGRGGRPKKESDK